MFLTYYIIKKEEYSYQSAITFNSINYPTNYEYPINKYKASL